MRPNMDVCLLFSVFQILSLWSSAFSHPSFILLSPSFFPLSFSVLYLTAQGVRSVFCLCVISEFVSLVLSHVCSLVLSSCFLVPAMCFPCVCLSVPCALRVPTPHLFPISRVGCIIGFTCVLLVPLV